MIDKKTEKKLLKICNNKKEVEKILNNLLKSHSYNLLILNYLTEHSRYYQEQMNVLLGYLSQNGDVYDFISSFSLSE